MNIYSYIYLYMCVCECVCAMILVCWEEADNAHGGLGNHGDKAGSVMNVCVW